MYEIASSVSQWLADGLDPFVAQVVATRGFSSRDPGTAAAWVPGSPAIGRLIEGLDVAALSGTGVLEVTISEDDAVRAGLACGGVATVLVQPASAYPAEAWGLLADRAPVALVSTIQGTEVGDTELFTPDTIRSVRDRGPHGEQIARQLGRGVSVTTVFADEPRTAAVTLWPVPTLVVVGDGLIAAALTDTATLLGWRSAVTPSVEAAVAAVGELHPSDAVVVLSHSRDVDGPALAAALRGGAGYVGALGSRHTQAARRDWLGEHDVDADEQDRIHGPAGLDIDAHTPVEISISIVAEILAVRAGSSGGALRERGGPVHVAGVPAPPPRY